MRRTDTIERFVAIGAAMEEVVRRAAKDVADLQYRDARILLRIYHRGRVTRAQLADDLQCTTTNVTQSVGNLLKLGLVDAVARVGQSRAELKTNDKGDDVALQLEQRLAQLHRQLFTGDAGSEVVRHVLDVLERRPQLALRSQRAGRPRKSPA